MVKKSHLFKLLLQLLLQLLLLVSIVISLSVSGAEPEQATNQPVWAGMKPAAKQPTEPENGFVKPPPAKDTSPQQKLTARIVPTNPVVQKGEIITFTIESNETGLRYYWISDGVKNTKSSFAIKTDQLKPGKHRVRATVTNKHRKQAHASVFFFVTEAVADTAAGTSPSDPDSATTQEQPTELPAVNPESSLNTADKAIELPTPVISTKEGPEADEVDEVKGSEDTTDNKLIISPSRVTIEPGGKALFKSNVSRVEGYQFDWKFLGRHNKQEQFEIHAENLEPGSYQVYLTVIGKDSKKNKATATLRIRSHQPVYTFVPNLIGSRPETIEEKVKAKNLLIGDVTKRPVKGGKGTIIEQTPSAGNRILQGSAINVVVGVSRMVLVPDLSGLNQQEVTQKLAKYGLEVGRILTKINDQAVGLLVSQDPKAGARFQRGLKVNLVFGKSAPKPLTAIIQPSSSVVESGKQLELTAVIVEPEVDHDLTFTWLIGDQKSTDRFFRIDTSKLSVGDHKVELLVKDADNRSASVSANITVTARTIAVPELVGKSVEEAKTMIKQAGLELGDIQTQAGDVENETILQQYPSSGEQVAAASKINLLIVIPKPEEASVISLQSDVNEVKAGEAVTFSLKLTPKPTLEEVHYVYAINEEKKANVKPTLQWTPDKEGIYTVTVAAFSKKGLLAQSSALTINVLPAWEMPVAKIIPEVLVVQQGDSAEFVSTSTYDLNTSLDYNWSSDTGHGGAKKQFVFDTADIEPGSYSITLTVTDDKGNQSTASTMLVVQVGGNSSGKGGATGLSEPDSKVSAIKPEIMINSSKRFITTGSRVNLQVLSNVLLDPAYYYFETGDGKNTQWLQTAEVEHKYEDFGAYRVRAAVKKGEKVYYSDSLTIWVFSPMLFLIMGGLAVFAYAVIWWWTKYIPSASRGMNKTLTTTTVVTKTDTQNATEEPVVTDGIDNPSTSPPIADYKNQQVSLREDDIVTEIRSDAKLIQQLEETASAEEKKPTVVIVLLKGFLQFILGIAISILALYLILRAMNLI